MSENEKTMSERVKKSLEGLRPAETRKRAVKFAKASVEFQKKSVLGVMERVEKLQDKAESRMAEITHDSKYVPAEGKTVVDEWIGLAKKSRRELKKSTTKSYDLMLKYVGRLDTEAETAEA